MVIFGTLHPDGSLTDVREVAQSDIRACRFTILVPGHYREDGACKCNDPEHRAMMIREWGYTEADFDPDFSVLDGGSILLIRPLTDRAVAWVEDNIGEGNGYQPYWPTVIAEHRYAHDIIAGMLADGLISDDALISDDDDD